MSLLSLSPSRLSLFFYHECERYLRYHATPRKMWKEAGIPPIPWDTSPVTKAILEGGYNWEQRVIQTKLRGRVKIAEGKGPLHQRAFDAKTTLNILSNLSPGEAIYQATLITPYAFLDRYGLSSDLCEFPACRPDLIQFVQNDGRPSYRVIDVKASTSLKTSHRIQATLYTLMLRDILVANHLELPLDLENAGIWLFDRNEPEWFDLSLSISIVERFLGDQLAKILTAPMEELSWHLFFRCEWCEFYEHCRKEAEEHKSISLIPYLSVGGREYLKEAPFNGGKPVNSLSELKTFLSQPHADQALEGCGSLRARGNRLRNALVALEKEEVVPHGGSSLALPVNENVSIIMTPQSDPVTGQIYAAGFRRLKGKDVYGKGIREEIFIARTPGDCQDIRHQFLSTLFEELKTLHDFNETREWSDQKSLQTYVFDGYELILFNQMLQESLTDSLLAKLALQMLFYFQDTSLADADEHPVAEIPFPVIVITGVIRQLVALPIPISLRLPEVCKVLPSPTFNFSFEANDLFWFGLSNTLRSDAIFQAWEKGRVDAVDWIHDELLRRLRGGSAIIDGLRNKVKDCLFAWPPKFLFPGAIEFKNPELSRLAFIARYESFMGALAVRENRSLPWSERVLEGTSIPLRYEGGGKWRVLSKLDSSVLEESGEFFSFILVPHGEAGERAQMGYNDYTKRKTMWAPKGIVRIARLTREPEIDPTTGLITHILVETKEHRDQKPFEKGEKAVLHPRFTDFTSDRVLKCLAELDSRPNNDLLYLIRKPWEFAFSLPKSDEIAGKALEVADKIAGFTESQSSAFQQVLTGRLTLVWGPPGTGKTHFLAKAILSLTKARKEVGKGLRVAVTAFTHAAIENLLAEIQEHISAFDLDDSLALYKLKHVSTPRGRGLKVLDERGVRSVFGNEFLVVGGTVYSFFKAEVEGEFPLLIVDEASQMKFGEFAIVAGPLSNKGRLLLAGDDLQLPPILQGAYPEPGDGLPGLHDSIFAYLRARDKEELPYTYQLKENWRMNETLSLFPAETLYGRDYKPMNKEIGAQKLAFIPSKISEEKEDEVCDWLIDPVFPLSIAVLEDVRAAVENFCEAELVAKLAFYLRANLLMPKSKSTYPETEEGDREFWRRGLFIVSPHHAQIRAIKYELAKLRKWLSPAFVDTVDKMQGQQSQSVIVSYGVSDVETALAEAEFIYSLNRLNVSVSRARAKCLVFLPRPLLEPSFDVLQNEKAARGISHMHALVEFCRRHGEERQFQIKTIHSPKEVMVTAFRATVS
jgi:DNA replication ATP-dependent helicase Dna2